MDSRRAFPHRSNSDGTFDSICTICFMTIATTEFEADLAASERKHVCLDIHLITDSQRLMAEARRNGSQSGHRQTSFSAVRELVEARR